MRSALTRLLAGLFIALSLAGCPEAVPAKPPVPVQAFLYSWDWTDPGAWSATAMQTSGITGVIAVSQKKFDPNERTLSLDELRTEAQAIKARCAPLAVAWSFSCTCQAGNPLPTSPARTFVDVAHRTMLLDNYASIGRVAKESGFPAVALDVEPWTGAGCLAYPQEPGTRQFGSDLVTKGLRRENAGLQVMAFAPLSAEKPLPAFQPLIRGMMDAAGKSGVFFNEDLYGLAAGIDARKVLVQTGAYTDAALPSAGWFASAKAPDLAGWYQAAVPQLQAAARLSPYVMVYREGPMTPEQQAALGRTLHALQGP